MWHDIKMWLIIRYVRSRIYGEKSSIDIKEGIIALESDTDKIFLNKEVLIHEVFKLKKRLLFMFFPVSWRRHFTKVSFDGWEKIRSYTAGPITSIFETALEEEKFLESYSGIISLVPNMPDMSGYGYNRENKIEKIVIDKYIRVSRKGEGFKSWGGGLLYLTKKYKEVWVLVWFFILWLFVNIFLPIFCKFFPNFRICLK